MGSTKYFILLLSLLISQPSPAQSIIGKVTSEYKDPIPFVNVFCTDLNTGSSTNLDGEFILKLRIGKNRIIISCVGYINDTLNVDLRRGEIKRVEIELEEKSTELQTIYIFESNLSEAERIILRTISSKENYLKRIQHYEYNAYDKSVMSFRKKDSLIIGGVFETQLKGYYQYPDKFNEIIVSKRQTKNILSSINNFFTMGRVPNVLEEELRIDDLAIISPLNSNALNYYSYGIIDTIFWNNKRIFRLEFFPKNKFLPLFSGKIGILDSLYVPVTLNLKGGKSIQTIRSKDLEIEEKFIELNDGLWFPNCVIQKYIFKFDFPGYPDIYFDHTWLLSDYKINSADFSYKFSNSIQSENLLPEVESEKLWNTNQIMLLTVDEKKAVKRIDSVMTNLSFIGNAFFSLFKFGFEGGNKLPITSLNDFYHFNRVEGHYAGAGLKLDSIFHKTNLAAKFGYGFSDKKMKFSFELSKNFYLVTVSMKLFGDLIKLNQFYDYSIFDLTYQSWFCKNDYADYYYSKGMSLGIDFTPDKNFVIRTEFTKRTDFNSELNSDWSLSNRDGQYRFVRIIDEGEITNYSLLFKYDNRKYVDMGFIKYPNYAYNFLNAELKITKGLYSGQRDDSYWQLNLNVFGIINTAGLLNPHYNLLAGSIIGKELVQNRYHLPGLFAYASSMNTFSSIRSDVYSGSEFVCLFFENNFRNILFNMIGIPFLKETKYDLILFGKYGWINNSEQTNEPNHIYEAGISISNIFTFLRFDFTWHIKPNDKDNFYFTLGSLISF